MNVIFLILLFGFYQILTFLMLPAIFVYLLWRKLQGKNFGAVADRLGFVARPASDRPVVWVHAVSVGEVLSVEHVIADLRATGACVYLTVGTSSAFALARNLGADQLAYLPLDLLPCLLIAFRRIRPAFLVVVEAELWPNLLMLAALKNVPRFLLNGRVSHRPGRLRALGRRIITSCYFLLDHLFVQSNRDQAIMLQLKIPYQKITVLGNIKAYNVWKKREIKEKLAGGNAHVLTVSTTHQPNSTLHHFTGDTRVLLVGSLHPGELAVYLNLFRSLQPTFPKIKMIIAPRHFHWQAILRTQIQNTGLTAYFWTPTNDLPSPELSIAQRVTNILATHDMLLVCRLGFLFDLYPLADLFFLGGTFVPVGGHNLLEPAAWGVPSIIGPHHQNSKDTANALEMAGGLIKVDTEAHLLTVTLDLLKNNSTRQLMSSKTIDWIKTESTKTKQGLDKLIQEIQSSLQQTA